MANASKSDIIRMQDTLCDKINEVKKTQETVRIENREDHHQLFQTQDAHKSEMHDLDQRVARAESNQKWFFRIASGAWAVVMLAIGWLIKGGK